MRNLKSLNSGIAVLALSIALSSISPGVQAESTAVTTRDASSSGVVNINTATAKQLSLLPGIGPSKAQAIVDYRSKREFKKVEELARVKGIGRKTVRKLKSLLTVSGETTLKKKPSGSK